MTQNARLARWVPTTVNVIADSIVTATTPRPEDGAIDTLFQPAGGGAGSTVEWASNAETTTGTEGLKAISHNTLRDEMVREFAIPEAAFTGPVAISSNTGVPANDGNRLLKTNASGFINQNVMPTVIDAGTF
jgi:hypothetical protein